MTNALVRKLVGICAAIVSCQRVIYKVVCSVYLHFLSESLEPREVLPCTSGRQYQHRWKIVNKCFRFNRLKKLEFVVHTNKLGSSMPWMQRSCEQGNHFHPGARDESSSNVKDPSFLSVSWQNSKSGLGESILLIDTFLNQKMRDRLPEPLVFRMGNKTNI